MIKGYYINLESSQERRAALTENLKSLGIENIYKRFNAIKGDPSEAKKSNLKAGELGLWSSWISLLKQETQNTKTNYRYLHIMEDDVVLDEITKKAFKVLHRCDEEFDMLFTDMYVNPSVHSQFGKYCKRLIRKEKVSIERDIYTGCTSSVILKRESIQKIYNLLDSHINGQGKKIPLDNYIRRLMNDKKLTIRVMIPFTTSIQLDQIHNSTIQETDLNHQAISTSQALCGLMRRDLSYIRNPENMQIQASRYVQILEDYASKRLEKEKQQDMMDIFSKYCLENRLLRYKYEPRLLNEKLNAQIHEDWS
ncbi:glycosyltransferase family 25 protein [bacterium]|nr:glycosyltransferase family 25 protein [bacterium]